MVCLCTSHPPAILLISRPTACCTMSLAIRTMWWQPLKAPSSSLRRPQSHQRLALRREVKDLRRRLRGRFFADHVKDYSASRRYAPIYWYLAVPSREWGLWVYAPALSREMLFAIAGSARDKLRRLREQARQLHDRHLGTADRAVVERIEQVESLAGEIEQFAEHAEKIAQSGWRPDLNDGLILCAAPLEPLFADDAWRKRVAQYRKDLETKKYPWATVQREFFGDRS